MGWNEKYGYWIFFGVPFVLWIIGAGATIRKGHKSPFLAYIAGSDHRLSLSRLQAFLWTLTIFGAFAAAMAIHTKISSTSQAEINRAKTAAAAAAEKVKAAETEAAKAAPADKPAKEQALAEAKVESQAADNKVKGYEWVGIPPEILALAGIAIGSGVFSSFIAASNSEEKTACVTDIKSNPLAAAAPVDSTPDNASQPINTLLIYGQNMGNRGKVKFGRALAAIRDWKEDGTQIYVTLPSRDIAGPLVVDTPNGKLSYKIEGAANNLTLGEPTVYYEFADLFRDDKNPDNLDLMKFQMFGWTVVAILIYVYLFLSNLRPDLTELPNVPQSIALLTGVSQAGYLAGKGISNIKKEG